MTIKIRFPANIFKLPVGNPRTQTFVHAEADGTATVENTLVPDLMRAGATIIDGSLPVDLAAEIAKASRGELVRFLKVHGVQLDDFKSPKKVRKPDGSITVVPHKLLPNDEVMALALGCVK